MNTRFTVIAAVALMSFAASAARAAQPPSEKLEFFGALEYYFKSDVDDEVIDSYNDAVDALGNASYEATTTGAIGGRLGLRKPLSGGRFDIGGSVGLVAGPVIEVDFTDNTPPPGTIDEEISLGFLRFLVEAGARIPVTARAYLRLGGGIGMGRAAMEDRFEGTGFYAGKQTFKESDTGVTWEISPSFVITASRADLEIGLRYVQFPKIKETATTFEVDWRTLGFFIAAAF